MKDSNTKNEVGFIKCNDDSQEITIHGAVDNAKSLDSEDYVRDIKGYDWTKAGEWTEELRDLAPVDDISDFETYEKMLNWIFQNERVKNIALSGPYGSGKSSVIETYLKRNEAVKKTSIKISMATFLCRLNDNDNQGGEQGTTQAKKVSISEEEIEETILKQLFYKVDPEKIPQSSYRKHCARSRGKIKELLFVTMLLASVVSALIFPSVFSNFFAVIDRFMLHSIFKTSLMRLLEVLGFLYLVAMVIEREYGVEISKFHLKELKILANATVQSKVEESESVFHRNLDEIMYFFEETGYRNVFFEDIDRTDNISVFLHLRGLNQLLNNSDVIKEKPIRFIYAMKEDFVDAESRTKFFDFIIPVIPVINSTNSCEKMIEHIGESRKKGIEINVSNEFIYGIGDYISDMRVLLNIYNEFLVYKQALKKQMLCGLKDEKMLAMMAFKSMCPREFADIQAEKGALKQVFSDKNIFVSKEKKRIDDRIYEKMEEIKKEQNNDGMAKSKSYSSKAIELEIKELTSQRHGLVDITLKQLMSRFPSAEIISKDVAKNKLLTFLLSQGYIDEGYSDYINYFYMNSIEGDCSGDADRVFILHVKQQDPLEFKFRLDNPSVVVSHLHSDHFQRRAIYNFDVLKWLIESGDTNRLSVMLDKLSDETGDSWDFIDGFRRYEQADVSRKFVEKLSERWEGMWKYISDNRSIMIGDITEEIEGKTVDQLRTFVSKIRSDGLNGIKYLLFASRLYYFKTILLSENPIVLIKQNEDGEFKRYLESDPDIVKKIGIDGKENENKLERFRLALMVMEIKFKKLNIDGVSNGVLEVILSGEHYELNGHMINALISRIFDRGKVKNIKLNQRPYTGIVELVKEVCSIDISNCTKGPTKLSEYINLNKDNKAAYLYMLASYINSSFEEYVKEFVLTRSKLEDDSKDIVEMLRKLGGNHEIQDKLIKKEKFTLDDIAACAIKDVKMNPGKWNHVWGALLKYDKVKVSLNNVSAYFKVYGLDRNLECYIRLHAKELNKRSEVGGDIDPKILRIVRGISY